MGKKTVLVECTFRIPVEVDEDSNYQFQIEENGCPGTGIVGLAIDEHIEKSDNQNLCWACLLGGSNKIVADPLPPKESAPKEK